MGKGELEKRAEAWINELLPRRLKDFEKRGN